VPFVAKATGVAVAKIAVRVMLGHSLAQLRADGLLENRASASGYVCVKEAVLPFNRFPSVDTILGPEMRSTGEVMGVGESFGIAFAKAQLAAGTRLPHAGTVFLSLANRDKAHGLVLATQLVKLGFRVAATAGTAALLEREGISVGTLVGKVGINDGAHDAVELISSGQVHLVINTPSGRGARVDGAHIRAACVQHQVPCLTTVAAGLAAARGITDSVQNGWTVRSLQELHQ
jgi:carbamoyl-phosphate synthase large subunit